MALYAKILTSYANAAALIKQHSNPIIVGWEISEEMLEKQLVIVTVLLGPQEHRPAVFELVTLLEAAEEVNPRLQSQAEVHQDIPAALVQIAQTEFSESFH